MLILASSSPRRKELLKDAGIKFEVITADVNVDVIDNETPQMMVERLSFAKAKKIAESHGSRWVLGADTTVTIDNQILSKPIDRSDAKRMLLQLQGRAHTVWSGYSIINLDINRSITKSFSTEVTMIKLSEDQIIQYIATGEPMDKAGSYAIQGIGASLIESINGSYTNVVGLPLSHVINDLKELGLI